MSTSCVYPQRECTAHCHTEPMGFLIVVLAGLIVIGAVIAVALAIASDRKDRSTC